MKSLLASLTNATLLHFGFCDETDFWRLLRTALVRDGLFAWIVGPNRRLNARAALIAHQAGVGSRLGTVIGHAAATGQQQ